MIAAFFIFLLLSGCAGIYENGKDLATDTKPYIEEITVDELNAKIENSEEFFLIDVRQPAEFEKGDLPYSTLIPRGILEFKIGNSTFWEDDQQWFVPEKDAEKLRLKKDQIVKFKINGKRKASLFAFFFDICVIVAYFIAIDFLFTFFLFANQIFKILVGLLYCVNF